MKPAVLLCTVRDSDVLAEGLLARADLELLTLFPSTGEMLGRGGIAHRAIDAKSAAGAVRQCLCETDLRLILLTGESDITALAHEAHRLAVPIVHIAAGHSGGDVRPSFVGPNDVIAGSIDEAVALAIELIDNPPSAAAPRRLDPGLEAALAAAVPARAKRVLVVGRVAGQLADAIRQPCEVQTADDHLNAPDGPFDAVVFSEALPHSAVAEEQLQTARSVLDEGGSVVAAFRNGAGKNALEAFVSGRWAPPRKGGEPPTQVGGYSPVGIGLVLSRADLEISAARPVSETNEVTAWVVTAKPRPARLSPFGRERQDRRMRAGEANKRGETLYAEGDMTAAAAAFGEAIELWNQDAVYFNNLATALYALGCFDEAWSRAQEALHFDPNLQSARDNLRVIAKELGRLDEAEEILCLFGMDSEE